MNHTLTTRFEILKDIFSDYFFNENKNEFVTWCFNKAGCNGGHHKKKLEINIEKNVFDCWVCGYSGFITKLLMDCDATKSQRRKYLSTIHDLVRREESAESERCSVQWPESNYFLLDALDDAKAIRSYEWLRFNVGLSNNEIFQHKIGFCKSGDYKDRLLFPSFSSVGNLDFFVTRDIDRTDNWKYLNCSGIKVKNVIFNEILIDWNEPIIIVEGIKSYLKHFKIKNIIPIFGSRFTQNFELFKETVLHGVPTIYIALDDEAKQKSYEIMKLYYSYGMDVRLVDLSDVNQPDELETDSFASRIESATKFSYKDSLRQQIEKIRKNL